MKFLTFFSFLLALLPACSVLKPVKDAATYHLLEATVPDRPLTAASPAIAINRATLPGYLDRQQVVTRADGQLLLSPLDLWAEPLDESISRVLAANLGRLTGSLNIQPIERFSTLDYTSLLEVRIARFEADSTNQLFFEGTWKRQPVKGGESPSRPFNITIPLPPASPASMTPRVTAMNQALETLARQILKN